MSYFSPDYLRGLSFGRDLLKESPHLRDKLDEQASDSHEFDRGVQAAIVEFDNKDN